MKTEMQTMRDEGILLNEIEVYQNCSGVGKEDSFCKGERRFECKSG